MAGGHTGAPLQSLVEPLLRLQIWYGECLHDGLSELRGNLALQAEFSQLDFVYPHPGLPAVGLSGLEFAVRHWFGY